MKIFSSFKRFNFAQFHFTASIIRVVLHVEKIIISMHIRNKVSSNALFAQNYKECLFFLNFRYLFNLICYSNLCCRYCYNVILFPTQIYTNQNLGSKRMCRQIFDCFKIFQSITNNHFYYYCY